MCVFKATCVTAFTFKGTFRKVGSLRLSRTWIKMLQTLS